MLGDKHACGSVDLLQWTGCVEVTTQALAKRREAAANDFDLMRLPGEIHIAILQAPEGWEYGPDVREVLCGIKWQIAFEAPFRLDSPEVCLACRQKTGVA